MAYLRKISSLEEMAMCQVAFNLCQDNDFKEVAMCFEKPTYGLRLSSSVYFNSWKKVEEWDAAIDMQCEKLMKDLPQSLKCGVQAWIYRIAVEYSSYSRRMELFGVSRYQLMDILTRGDWTETGRLNEKKLAKRLLKDERFPTLQRYRIACVYCLHVNIPELWSELTPEEIQLISRNDDPYLSQEKNGFVLLWSHNMNGHRNEKVTGRKHLWNNAAMLAVHYGNRAALMQCWKRLNKNARNNQLINRALQSIEMWNKIQRKDKWRKKLVANVYYEQSQSVERFNLPSYYSELANFFLLNMSENQQLRFFKIVFDNHEMNASILDCFLEWPLQDNFLPIMSKLWGIAPKDEYVHCLVLLIKKYNGDYECYCTSELFYKRENHYDYQSLLWKLWEETPEEYKQFCYKKQERYAHNWPIRWALLELLKKSPFQEKDFAICKHILHDAPQEWRIEMIHSHLGKGFCFSLIDNERLSFLDWLLKHCLPNVEISGFKKQLIEYNCYLCVSKLDENHEKFVEDFIDWAFELEADKIQFKCRLMSEDSSFLDICTYYLKEKKFTKVESMISFFPSTEKVKRQFKENVAKQTCRSLLNNCEWEHMNKCLSWGFDAEEKIKDFKKYLFCIDGFDIHHNLVFIKRQWENVRHFYKWFSLSDEEIIKIKKDTLFATKVIENAHGALLHKDLNVLLPSLCWCLTDEEMLICFKKKVEEQYFSNMKITKKQKKGHYFANMNLKKKEDKAKERLDYLESELIRGFREEVVHDRKTNRDATSMKDKEQKRSLEIENESNSPSKRFHQNAKK